MKKSFIITSMAAFAALCFGLTAQAQGPVVVSDKDDYVPGEIALFQAAGFQPNELLDFSVAISDDQAGWIPDIAWADVQADGSGGAEVDYVVPETWADKTLQLTVMGLSSGLIATTTFTDSVTSVTVTHVNGVAVASLPVTITSLPATLTVKFDYVTSATGTTTADLDLLTTPTAISNSGVSIPAGTHTGQTISLTIPSGTTNQTANVKVTVHNFTGGGANNKNDVVNTAVTIAVPSGPTPTPPVITPVTANVDLGQIVGCLDDNNVIGTAVHVDYSVVEDLANTDFSVYATFNGGNPTLIGTIHDDNGNLPSSGITLNPTSQDLPFSGPGTHMSAYGTSVTAQDSTMLSDGPKTCPLAGSQVTVQVIYNFSGFFAPLSGQINCKVKNGSGVPVKFSITDCDGDPISTGTHTISVVHLVGCVPAGPVDVEDAGNSNGDTENFRWDPTGMQWIFNLKTGAVYGYAAGNTYQITAHLDDGTDHSVTIAIK